MPIQRIALVATLLAAYAVMPQIPADVPFSEGARLRRHFDTVDRELRDRDVSSLSERQRSARSKLINWLRDYRNAGLFPENNRFPNRAAPFFRDDRGALCAMAYLIARSGRTDIVDRIAATKNNAYIRELADDHALVGWLGDAGLTAGEAARIQPTYGCEFYGTCPQPKTEQVDFEYGMASMVTGIASATAIGVSLAKPTRANGWVALVLGGIEVVGGASQLSVNGKTTKVSMANIVVGSVAIGAGIRALRAATGRAPAAGQTPQDGKTLDWAVTSRGLQLRITF